MALCIQDTKTGEKRPFEPIEPGKVKLYVCGVTPYARCHLGHARCYVAYDVIYRYLGRAGYDVTYVRNFTDVDDKIIKRAGERGVDPLALAQGFIETFYEDMDALGVARPQVEPRVSTTIGAIIALVKRLEERGLAYSVDGDVFYEVDRFGEYGQLSGRNLTDMRAGERVQVDPRKRNPMDFALWKSAKPGEPKWDSPWGEGRPGWHIECSAMSMEHLGEVFDIHGGGRDLIFPHHENERAQSMGATGHPNVRYWTHNGFININKEKMSKSLGNVFDVADVLKRYEPQALRYFLIAASHYRNPVNFSDTMLDEAADRVRYFYETLRKTAEFIDEADEAYEGPRPAAEIIAQLAARFDEAMDDDFNTPRAMEPVLDAFKQLNELVATRKAKKRAAARSSARLLRAELMKLDPVLNLLGQEPTAYLERHRAKAALRHGVEIEAVERRISERIAARQARDWAGADAIRDELLEQGVVLMDFVGGTDWSIADVRADATS